MTDVDVRPMMRVGMVTMMVLGPRHCWRSHRSAYDRRRSKPHYHSVSPPKRKLTKRKYWTQLLTRD